MPLPPPLLMPRPGGWSSPRRPSKPAAEALHPAAACRLVLLVGAALRPDAALLAALARDGIRVIWRDSSGEAARTAALANFDAVCVDTTTLGAAAAALVRRLRDALSCPLLVIGSGADSGEEIDALDGGADLFLARPVPTRRLVAHLRAVLRRLPAPAGSEAAVGRAPRAVAPLLRRRATEASASPATIANVNAAALLERLLASVGHGAASAELDGALSLRANPHHDGVDVTIRGLRLRLR